MKLKLLKNTLYVTVLCFVGINTFISPSTRMPSQSPNIALIDIPLTTVPVLSNPNDPQANYAFFFEALRYLNYHLSNIFLHTVIPNSYIAYRDWRQLLNDLLNFVDTLNNDVLAKANLPGTQSTVIAMDLQGQNLAQRLKAICQSAKFAVNIAKSSVRGKITTISQEHVFEPRIQKIVDSLTYPAEIDTVCNALIRTEKKGKQKIEQLALFSVALSIDIKQWSTWKKPELTQPGAKDQLETERKKFEIDLNAIKPLVHDLVINMSTEFAQPLEEDSTLPPQFQIAETWLYKIVPAHESSFAQKMAKIAIALVDQESKDHEPFRNQLLELIIVTRIARQLGYNQQLFVTQRIACNELVHKISSYAVQQQLNQKELKNNLFFLNFLIDEIFEYQSSIPTENSNAKTLAESYCSAHTLFLQQRITTHSWINEFGKDAVEQSKEATRQYEDYRKRIANVIKQAHKKHKNLPPVIFHEPEAWRTGTTGFEKFTYRTGAIWNAVDIPGFFKNNFRFIGTIISGIGKIGTVTKGLSAGIQELWQAEQPKAKKSKDQEKSAEPAKKPVSAFAKVTKKIKKLVSNEIPKEPDWDFYEINRISIFFVKKCDDKTTMYPFICKPWYPQLIRCMDYLMLNLVTIFDWDSAPREVSSFEEQCQALGILKILSRYQWRFYELNAHFPFMHSLIARMYGQAFVIQINAFILCNIIGALNPEAQKNKELLALLQRFVAAQVNKLLVAADKLQELSNDLLPVTQTIDTTIQKSTKVNVAPILKPAQEAIKSMVSIIHNLASKIISSPIEDIINGNGPQYTVDPKIITFDLDGKTIAHTLAEQDNNDKFISTAQANPALISFPDNIGITPLHILVSKGNLSGLTAIKDIIPAHAWLMRDPQGQTPLHYALIPQTQGAKPNAGIVTLITTDPNGQKSIGLQDDFGFTPLHYAVLTDQEDVAEAHLHGSESIAQQTALVAALLSTPQGKESVRAQNKFNQTPLHLAAIRAVSKDPREKAIAKNIILKILATHEGKQTLIVQDKNGATPWDCYQAAIDRARTEDLKLHGGNYPVSTRKGPGAQVQGTDDISQLLYTSPGTPAPGSGAIGYTPRKEDLPGSYGIHDDPFE